MKNILLKIGFLSSLLTFNVNASNVNHECYLNKNINYDTSFLKNTLIDTQNIVKNFQQNTECFNPVEFLENGYIKTKFSIDNLLFDYENFSFFGVQPFLVNGKIPDNSFILNHPNSMILLYQSNYLLKEDIKDYYLTLEQKHNVALKERTKIVYHSPYNMSKLNVYLGESLDSYNVIYEFEGSDQAFKNLLDNYLFGAIQRNNLPSKLETKNDLDILRIFLKGNYNSYNMLTPFIKMYLDSIDENDLNFSKNTKLEKIDSVYTFKNEKNPLTLFSEDVLINYTFDNKENKGLIVFSFIDNKEVAEIIKRDFNN